MRNTSLGLIAASILTTVLTCPIASVQADALNPNMCWAGMGAVGGLQSWGADADCDDDEGNFGRVTCGIRDNRSSCHYDVTDGVWGTQVTAQFQCCNASGTSCDGWAWAAPGWTPVNGSINNVVPCTGSTKRYAKVSCLVAAPCN
jgi:hypothetical protein